MTNKPDIKRLPGARAECIVTFPKEKVAPAEQRALQRLAGSVKLPGFRPGKAPSDLLRSHIDPQQLLDETIRTLLPDTFSTLLKEHELKPIIHPKVELQSRDPLTLKITFVERPEVKLKGAEKIKIEKKTPKVDDKDIERMVQYLLEQQKKTTEVDRSAKEGDQVEMDFAGTDESGKEIEGTAAKGYTVVIGSNSLIPGFEDALKGLKKGDKKTFTLKFPEKYQAEHLRGKPVTFAVTVTKVEDVTMPTLTDEFAKANFGEESAAVLKKKIEEQMRAQEENVESQRREQALLEKIREATQVEIAPELVDDEEQSLLEELRQQLDRQRLTLADWVKQMGKKPEELQKEMRDRATKRLQLRFGLGKLVDEKNARLTPEQMKPVMQEFLGTLPEDRRLDAAGQMQIGSDLYERVKWQREVENVIAEMLAA
ncbi:trigger factor [Candidatus Peregrinibacteria bacterium]|nr:trigger factor [Candidatus Peregrinibacteria bacterium]